MTEPFVLLRDAAAPVLEMLKREASARIALAEFDAALAALERFGSVIEKPVGLLRAVRACFAELLGHD